MAVEAFAEGLMAPFSCLSRREDPSSGPLDAARVVQEAIARAGAAAAVVLERLTNDR
jgi:hypothetical protein